MHHDIILDHNPAAIVFKFNFPIQKPLIFEEDVKKEFDFVFFSAQVTNKKGIEDALDAIVIVRQKNWKVSLNVVGKCALEYKKILLNKINTLGIIGNVTFKDYYPVHADMHDHIRKARFALLPLKLDIISSALIEAMSLGLPVVTYKTTGTPYLNKDGETVLLAEIGDVDGLAANMFRLLNSPELADKLQKDAILFVNKNFDNTTSARRLVDNYRAVIDHYHYNTPIPKELLFDLNEFPIY